MKMIVGLGNPGSEYKGNRHNLGFMAIDHFSKLHQFNAFKEQKQSLTLKARLPLTSMVSRKEVFRDLLLVKPLTYMNLSGNAVWQLLSFYKIPTPDLLIISEDINIPFGSIKIRPRGGSGGHNGLKSIQMHLGENYPRLRFGVGNDFRIPLEKYVLTDFPREEKEKLPQYLDQISEAITDFIAGYPLDKIMAKYNGSEK